MWLSDLFNSYEPDRQNEVSVELASASRNWFGQLTVSREFLEFEPLFVRFFPALSARGAARRCIAVSRIFKAELETPLESGGGSEASGMQPGTRVLRVYHSGLMGRTTILRMAIAPINGRADAGAALATVEAAAADAAFATAGVLERRPPPKAHPDYWQYFGEVLHLRKRSRVAPSKSTSISTAAASRAGA